MERTHLLIAAAATVAASYFVLAWRARQEEGASPDASGPTTSITDNIMQTITRTFQTWRPPEQYAGAIAQAEDDNGIPRDILARLLWQESRYRADIINGATRSSVGAMGMAQFMPATAQELGIDPLDPAQAIDGAARYLARLYYRFGNWSEALAAYNWGQGNVARRGLDAAPPETVNYYTAILADVNAANGTAYA